MNDRPQVVIVGGGFAGLNCACKLASHVDVRVTLLVINGDATSALLRSILLIVVPI